jgi:hypothetical protein
MFLKALGPFLACVIGIVVVVAGKWTNGKGPIKVRMHAGIMTTLLVLGLCCRHEQPALCSCCARSST